MGTPFKKRQKKSPALAGLFFCLALLDNAYNLAAGSAAIKAGLAAFGE
jgi:hypothetical protein